MEDFAKQIGPLDSSIFDRPQLYKCADRMELRFVLASWKNLCRLHLWKESDFYVLLTFANERTDAQTHGQTVFLRPSLQSREYPIPHLSRFEHYLHWRKRSEACTRSNDYCSITHQTCNILCLWSTMRHFHRFVSRRMDGSHTRSWGYDVQITARVQMSCFSGNGVHLR